MKNYLTLVLALTVVSAPAFASRARLEALGDSENGSYYIDDARNIFLNPAQIVHYKKKLFLETGNDPGVTNFAGSATPDLAVTANRAEGGFTNTFGDFTYGVYFDHQSQKTLQNIAVANAATSKTFIAPDKNIEVFLAGEGSLNWGISAWWAGNDSTNATTYGDGNERTAKQIGVRLGIETGALQVFGTVGLVGTSYILDALQSEVKAKVGVDAGVTYKVNEATYFGKFLTVGSDIDNLSAAGSTDAQIRDTAYGIGAGWKHEMTKATNMFARLEADYEKAGVSGANVNTWNIPASVGAEAQALSWLTVRGSVQESVIGEQTGTNGRNSLAGTTTVSLGLGLTFGDVQIDGLVATGNSPVNPTNSNTGGNLAGFGTAPQSGSNWGLGDNMLSRISLTYNF